MFVIRTSLLWTENELSLPVLNDKNFMNTGKLNQILLCYKLLLNLHALTTPLVANQPFWHHHINKYT